MKERLFRYPPAVADFSVLENVETESGAHPVSYSVGGRGFVSGGKVTGHVKLTAPI